MATNEEDFQKWYEGPVADKTRPPGQFDLLKAVSGVSPEETEIRVVHRGFFLGRTPGGAWETQEVDETYTLTEEGVVERRDNDKPGTPGSFDLLETLANQKGSHEAVDVVHEEEQAFQKLELRASKALKILTLGADIAKFYRMPECEVGGPLHIVLEDENLERRHVQWCLDQLDTDWCVQEYNDDVRAQARNIGEQLLELSKKQRGRALDYAWHVWRMNEKEE